MNAEIEDLEVRAECGDVEAQLALARKCELEDRIARARAWFARAAKQGSAAALRSLAINLLTRSPIVALDGVNMMRSAAEKGDAEAAFVCAMLAAQDFDLPDRWRVALEYLSSAADRGWEFARAQLKFLGTGFAPADAVATTEQLPVRYLFDDPRIGVIENFAAAETCDWLIERARSRVARAQVYDAATGSGRIERARSNSSVEFNIAQTDIVLTLLRARIAATAAIPRVGFEASAVLHYAPGESFEPHCDFLDPAVPAYARDLAANGQRVATFLIYLNEDFEGGETDFPELGWRHKGRKGDALLFWNVTSSGIPDRRAFHAGLPTTTGEKWLLSQWLRQRPIP